jgi:tetratricopeptide (TPR) repeat protein
MNSVESVSVELGVMLTSALVRLIERKRRKAPPEPAPLVQEAHELERRSKEVLSAAVAAERARNASWSAIGNALGITRSSAHGRFGDHGIDQDASAEELLRQAWQDVSDLADKHLTPLAHSIHEVDADVREGTARRLRDVALDTTVSPEARLLAAEFLPAIRGRNPRQELEAALQEILSSSEHSVDAGVDFAVGDTMFQAKYTAGAAADDRAESQHLEQEIAAYRAALNAARRQQADPSQLTMLERDLALLLVASFSFTGDVAILDEAIELLNRAREVPGISECILRSGQADPLGSLAHALFLRYEATGAQADLDESIRLSMEDISLLCRSYGPEHPLALRAMGRLGVQLGQSGKPEAAVDWLRRAVDGLTMAFGPDHPETMASRRNLALFLAQTGKEQRRQAGQLLEEVLSGQIRLLGSQHSQTRETQTALLHNLAGRIDDGETELLDRFQGIAGLRVIPAGSFAKATKIAPLRDVDIDISIHQPEGEEQAANLDRSDGLRSGY